MERLGWITRPAVGVAARLRGAMPAVCDRLVDLVYPPQCALCKEDISAAGDKVALCEACRAQLAPPVAHWCPRCSAAVAYVPEGADDCIYCRGRDGRFLRVVALGNYRNELREAIWQTKFPAGEMLAQSLAKLLVQRRIAALRELNAQIVVPISMHWRRRLRRRTNGPEMMASVLAYGLGLPATTGALRRTKLTPRQAQSTLRQRLKNQLGSFKVRSDRRIRGRRVLLVDDVLTTGATCDAAAKALLAAGAASVVVAVIARAVGGDVL